MANVVKMLENKKYSGIYEQLYTSIDQTKLNSSGSNSMVIHPINIKQFRTGAHPSNEREPESPALESVLVQDK